jgi:hypothetical protein
MSWRAFPLSWRPLPQHLLGRQRRHLDESVSRSLAKRSRSRRLAHLIDRPMRRHLKKACGSNGGGAQRALRL